MTVIADGLPSPHLQRKIHEVQVFLAQNLAYDVDLNAIAAHASLSPYYFTRQFTAMVGMPPVPVPDLSADPTGRPTASRIGSHRHADPAPGRLPQPEPLHHDVPPSHGDEPDGLSTALRLRAEREQVQPHPRSAGAPAGSAPHQVAGPERERSRPARGGGSRTPSGIAMKSLVAALLEQPHEDGDQSDHSQDGPDHLWSPPPVPVVLPPVYPLASPSTHPLLRPPVLGYRADGRGRHRVRDGDASARRAGRSRPSRERTSASRDPRPPTCGDRSFARSCRAASISSYERTATSRCIRISGWMERGVSTRRASGGEGAPSRCAGSSERSTTSPSATGCGASRCSERPSSRRCSAISVPTCSGPDWDATEATRRLTSSPDREVGDALIDQSVMAGPGNVYRSEVCFIAGIDPRISVGDVPEPAALVELMKSLMDRNRGGGRRVTTDDPRNGHELWVYGRRGRPCRRCGTPIRSFMQGDGAGRVVYVCPRCQSAPGLRAKS